MKNWKRYAALILSVALMLTMFTACGKKDKDNGEDKKSDVPSAFADKLLEPYIKMILSGDYTYEATQYGGTPVTYAKSGNDKVLLSTKVNADGENTTLTLMKISGKYYIVFPTQKSYTQATDKEIKNYNLEGLFDGLSFDSFVNASFDKSGKVEYKGQTYKFEDYYTSYTQITNRFFFDDDDNLVMVGKVNSKGNVPKPNTIKMYETNSNTFDILNDYTLVEQTGTETKKAETTTTAKANGSASILG